MKERKDELSLAVSRLISANHYRRAKLIRIFWCCYGIVIFIAFILAASYMIHQDLCDESPKAEMCK